MRSNLVEQPQKASRLMSNTPVMMVLYIISDNRGSGRQAGPRWRSTLRLLSLGWSTEGHNPYSAQVLQLVQWEGIVPKKKHPWFRSRGYLHFDTPVSLSKAQSIVMSAHRVSSHSFYPFIDYEIESFKFAKNAVGSPLKKTKVRPIAYASHIDSHIYAYYARILSKAYEARIESIGLEDNVLAFRSLGKSNIEFANTAFEDIKARGKCSVVALDISGFFDNLDHQILKQAWINLLNQPSLPKDHYNVFKSLTRFSRVNRDKLYRKMNISISNPKNNRFRVCDAKTFRNNIRGGGLIEVNKEKFGIPQGSPISALLSNIYMLEFDQWAKHVMEEQGGSYYRYCDDMLFITTDEHRDNIERFSQNEIEKLKLKINTRKTEVRDFWISSGIQTCEKPIQYLGFIFDGQKKLLRSAALARFSNRMKRGVRLAKATQRKRNRIKVSKGQKPTSLYKNKLYERYSHLSERNFITYSHRAANHMKSDAIRKQVKPLWERLRAEIEK